MTLEQLSRPGPGPTDLLRAYAEAGADWSSYQTTGNLQSFRNAAVRLCGAGQAVLGDYSFWAALETDLGQHVGPAWSEFVQNRQGFLDLELAIVLQGAQMPESEAVALVSELEGAIGSFVIATEKEENASHVIQTGAFRSRFEALNSSVCAAVNAPLQGNNPTQRNLLLRMASAVWRGRKAVGGIGMIGLNAAVGAGTIVIPFAAPITIGIVSGSVVGGATMVLS